MIRYSDTVMKQKADKIRKMNDKDLLEYIHNRVEKARAEERNKWKRKLQEMKGEK